MTVVRLHKDYAILTINNVFSCYLFFSYGKTATTKERRKEVMICIFYESIMDANIFLK